MTGCCLKGGRLQDVLAEDLLQCNPSVIYHLAPDGSLRNVPQIPDLSPGEGFLLYDGNFYIEPLEVQIDFLKAAYPEQWLTALLLRHIERVRQLPDGSLLLANMKEVDI